jgi:nucleotide-binding universal stress UspA family protein
MSTTENILVPMDGSPQAEAALVHALALPDVTITLLTVIDPFDTRPEESGYHSPVGRAGMPGYSEEWYEPTKERIRERFSQAQGRADARGLTLATVIEFGDPARSIVKYSERNGIDHIVMGSHGRSGLSRILRGSVSEAVMRRSPSPVTVVRDQQADE